MHAKDRTVIYFTDNVHSTFIVNDIVELSKRFYRLIIFSVDPVDKALIFADNVTVYENYLDWKKFDGKRILASNMVALSAVYVSECIKTKKLLPLKKSLALLASNIYKAGEITTRLKREKYDLSHAVFYSFWFYDCIFLAWLVKKNVAHTACSRAHGGDLFEERLTLKNKILFRHFQLKKLKNIYSVSKIGSSYLKEKYPAYAGKIQVAYLGSRPAIKKEELDKATETQALALLSCGNILNGKRIYLIAEALLACKTPVTWTHFGLAYEDDKYDRFLRSVDALKTKSNVAVHIMGSVPHEQIINFYKNNRTDLFISLSEAEGIPVTMMEASSYGVPILSTNVGGCNEIVTEKTGLLIDKDTDVNKVADILDTFKTSPMNTPSFRAGARQFWEQNFNIEKNYDQFCENINRS